MFIDKHFQKFGFLQNKQLVRLGQCLYMQLQGWAEQSQDLSWKFVQVWLCLYVLILCGAVILGGSGAKGKTENGI